MHYTRVYSTEEAVEAVLANAVSLVNETTGIVLIPDVVDGADRDEEEFGFRLNDGDWMYGFMEAIVNLEIVTELMAENESLEDYALGHIPAPGTIAPDRMTQYGADTEEEAREIIDELFAEEPSGWLIEEFA